MGGIPGPGSLNVTLQDVALEEVEFENWHKAAHDLQDISYHISAIEGHS
jgi:hypothetical protein